MDTEGEKTNPEAEFEETFVSEALYRPLESLNLFGKKRLAPIQGCTSPRGKWQDFLSINLGI